MAISANAVTRFGLGGAMWRPQGSYAGKIAGEVVDDDTVAAGSAGRTLKPEVLRQYGIAHADAKREAKKREEEKRALDLEAAEMLNEQRALKKQKVKIEAKVLLADQQEIRKIESAWRVCT